MRILLLMFLLISFVSKSQDLTDLKLDANKVKKYTPYLVEKHRDFNEWKKNNKIQYTKEIWYYTESFYVKRNYIKGIDVSGVEATESMDESTIDVSRFEHLRKENEEAVVTIAGFKDVIVLLPSNKLIYKP